MDTRSSDKLQRAEVAAEALWIKARSAENVTAAKAYNEQYVFSRVWRLVLKMVNTPPERSDLLVEHKCEIRALLLLLDDMGINIALADEAASKLNKLRNSDRK